MSSLLFVSLTSWVNGLSGFETDVSPSPSKIPDPTISQDIRYNLNVLSHHQRDLAVGITMFVWQQKESDGIICLPKDDRSYADMLVIDRGRRDKNSVSVHQQVVQWFL